MLKLTLRRFGGVAPVLIGCSWAAAVTISGPAAVQFKEDRPQAGESSPVDALEPDSKALLDAALKYLQNPKNQITITGHSDFGECHDDCVPLSQRRARLIADWLTSHGVAKEQIKGVYGEGAYRPVNPSDTPEAHAMNREVEFQP